jgi:hypothetical protein
MKKTLPIALALVVITTAAFAVACLPSGTFSVGSIAGTPGSVEKAGDRVEFGTWRDGPITWQVLAIEEGRALLISEDILMVRQYDNLGASSSGEIDWDTAGTTWAESDIRAWLNDEFLGTAFTTEEQGTIALSSIPNPDNPEYGTGGSVGTEDQVFLLSIEEAEQYCSDDSDRIAYLTTTEENIDYILSLYRDYFNWKQEKLLDQESSLRANLGKSEVHGWWLRSSGYHRGRTAVVLGDGSIDTSGNFASNYDGVRPVLWLTL